MYLSSFSRIDDMFFNKAKEGSNSWYLYPAMILILVIATQIGSIPWFTASKNAIESNPEIGTEDLDTFNANPDFAIFGIDSNLGFLYLLLPFVCGFIALYFVFPILHERKFKTLITWTDKIDWKRILFGFVLWMILGMMVHYINYIKNPSVFSYQFDLIKFIPLLFLSLLILPIQTSLEELVFRSYLLQGIGNMDLGMSRNSMIIIGWIFTSILFGGIHAANPEVISHGLLPMMTYYIGAGLFLGLITIWDGRLELALGVHAATNFISAVLVGYEGAAIQTNSIFKISMLDVVFATICFFIIAAIFTIICKYKYRWTTFFSSEPKQMFS